MAFYHPNSCVMVLCCVCLCLSTVSSDSVPFLESGRQFTSSPSTQRRNSSDIEPVTDGHHATSPLSTVTPSVHGNWLNLLTFPCEIKPAAGV